MSAGQLPETCPLFDDPVIPEWVKCEVVDVPRGEVRYTLDLDDALVEQMATGVCPPEVAQWCWEMLSWKREHYRNEARAHETVLV